MKKPLTASSGIAQGGSFKWAGAADFSRRYMHLESFSEKDKAIIMRAVNINAARAASAVYSINISIDGEEQAKRDHKELMARIDMRGSPS